MTTHVLSRGKNVREPGHEEGEVGGGSNSSVLVCCSLGETKHQEHRWAQVGTVFSHVKLPTGHLIKRKENKRKKNYKDKVKKNKFKKNNIKKEIKENTT